MKYKYEYPRNKTGQAHGLWYECFGSGELHFKGMYSYGKKVGVWGYYNKGVLVYKKYYISI